MQPYTDNVPLVPVTGALRVRGMVHLRVISGSMSPWIRPGDLLTIRPAEAVELFSGAVVLYARHGRLIVHRVLRRCGSDDFPSLVTKGDALASSDLVVSGSEVLGRVTQIMRGGSLTNLETQRQIIWSRLLAWVSPFSRFSYAAARLGKRMLIPAPDSSAR
jgi:signal peptidase I